MTMVLKYSAPAELEVVFSGNVAKFPHKYSKGNEVVVDHCMPQHRYPRMNQRLFTIIIPDRSRRMSWRWFNACIVHGKISVKRISSNYQLLCHFVYRSCIKPDCGKEVSRRAVAGNKCVCCVGYEHFPKDMGCFTGTICGYVLLTCDVEPRPHFGKLANKVTPRPCDQSPVCTACANVSRR